jgi:hypothetical protein
MNFGEFLQLFATVIGKARTTYPGNVVVMGEYSKEKFRITNVTVEEVDGEDVVVINIQNYD